VTNSDDIDGKLLSIVLITNFTIKYVFQILSKLVAILQIYCYKFNRCLFWNTVQ